MSTSDNDDVRAVAGSVLSAIAAAGNITLFASQIPLMVRLVRVDKDATKYDWLPSLTLMTTMSLWCGYTVWVLPTAQLFAANFSGIILPLSYLTLFVIYSKTTRRRLIITASTLFALAVTWGFSAGVYATGIDNAIAIGGGVTATVNCSFFISPLRQLARAVQLRDLARTPTLLSTVQFFQSIAWIAAATLIEDNFILGVNAAGFAFACLQLTVIVYVKWIKAKEAAQAGGGEASGEKLASSSPHSSPRDGSGGKTTGATVIPVEESAAGGGEAVVVPIRSSAEEGEGEEEGNGVTTSTR